MTGPPSSIDRRFSFNTLTRYPISQLDAIDQVNSCYFNSLRRLLWLGCLPNSPQSGPNLTIPAHRQRLTITDINRENHIDPESRRTPPRPGSQLARLRERLERCRGGRPGAVSTGRSHRDL